METRGGNSLSDMLGSLSRSTGNLVRSEINLAITELTNKARRAGRDAGLLAAGGALAYAGLLVMLDGVVRIFETFLPRWLAAMVVGGLAAGGGAMLALAGWEAVKNADLKPHRTMESLEQTADMAKREFSG